VAKRIIPNANGEVRSAKIGCKKQLQIGKAGHQAHHSSLPMLPILALIFYFIKFFIFFTKKQNLHEDFLIFPLLL
jgi:hypothetical protein